MPKKFFLLSVFLFLIFFPSKQALAFCNIGGETSHQCTCSNFETVTVSPCCPMGSDSGTRWEGCGLDASGTCQIKNNCANNSPGGGGCSGRCIPAGPPPVGQNCGNTYCSPAGTDTGGNWRDPWNDLCNQTEQGKCEDIRAGDPPWSCRGVFSDPTLTHYGDVCWGRCVWQPVGTCATACTGVYPNGTCTDVCGNWGTPCVPPPAVPPSPINLTAFCPGPGISASLGWNSDTLNFSLHIDDTANGWAGDNCAVTPNPGDICVNNLNTITYSFTSAPGHTYAWSVHAVNSVGSSTGTNGTNFTCLAATPTPTPTPTPAGPAAWFQARGGDVHANGKIRTTIPATCGVICSVFISFINFMKVII